MKKNYIQPLTEVVNVTAEQMICESLGFGSNKYNGSDAILSKRRHDYDDEEDEDDFVDGIW